MAEERGRECAVKTTVEKQCLWIFPGGGCRVFERAESGEEGRECYRARERCKGI